MQSELLTIDDVAEILNVPKSWLYQRTRLRGSERIPHIKLGRYLRFEESAVRDYIHGQKKGYLNGPRSE